MIAVRTAEDMLLGENTDFILVSEKKEINNPRNPFTFITEYILTVDMAKALGITRYRKCYAVQNNISQRLYYQKIKYIRAYWKRCSRVD